MKKFIDQIKALWEKTKSRLRGKLVFGIVLSVVLIFIAGLVLVVVFTERRAMYLNYNYLSDYNAYEVTGVDRDSYYGVEILIPSKYAGSPVISIADYAFEDCINLKSIIIPDSITSIGKGAFKGCSKLTQVHISDIAAWCKISFSSLPPGDLYLDGDLLTDLVIPNGVTSIGNYAFARRSGLTSITIPNSVTSIGAYAFNGCSGLTSITIPNSITSIGEYAFADCSSSFTQVHISDIAAWCKISFYDGSFNSLYDGSSNPLYYANLYLNGDLLTDLVIPSEVTSIGERAFYGCSGLTSIIIPNSVTSIDEGVFYGCSGLTSITIPDSVTSIGMGAFLDCIGLTSITIPDSVTSIGSYAFEGCSELTSITIPSSVTSIGSSAFSSCGGLTSITIENGVTSIGYAAFNGCSGLTSITIPDSVTSIDHRAFAGCSGLTSITIPFIGGSKITTNTSSSSLFGYIFGTLSYKDGASTSQTYSKGSSSISYYIPTSLKTVTVTGGNIHYGAFSYCIGLTSITIADSVTYIDDYAFTGCSSLTSITIADSVILVGDNALTGTAWYSNQPNGLVYAGKVAYKYKGTMPEGTSITLLSDTKGITNKAFSRCSGLTSITIPSSVTYIGSDAFSGCSGLTSITIPSSVTYIGSDAFSRCSGLMSITIPSSVTYIGSNAFSDCRRLTSIAIPDSVTIIGYRAFGDCNALQSISLPFIGASRTAMAYEAVFGYIFGYKTEQYLSSHQKSSSTAFLNTNASTTPTGATWQYSCYNYQPKNWTSSYCLQSYYYNIPASLRTVMINNTTSIPTAAFYNCSMLTSISINSAAQDNIGTYAFDNCSAIISYT